MRLDPGVALGVTWIVYRGTTEGVVFDRQRVAVKDGRVESAITFGHPGTYVIRGYADDGVLITPVDLTVTVK